jgi:anti-sigma B factor antagonist
MAPTHLAPAPFEVDQRTEDGVAVVSARGELDLDTAPTLCLAIERAAPPIVVDLTAVDFCDSTGMRALMEAAREVEARAGTVAIVVAPGGPVETTLVRAGVREFLDVAGSLPEALARCAGRRAPRAG